ncbi:MAG: family 78 glycoside hydrolase catalytic domain, partial [Oscillospiraceae bacterium]|nr:family 78 glycoside hydrolase catalytic domain [Oscillospiraceae bacterium]
MQFHSKWITTKDFIDSERIDVYRKELDLKKVKASEITFSHSYFRNTFNAKSSEKYIINISADDYYKLYVNGRFVCQGPANSYHDTYYYNSVDITPYIADGENAIGIHVYYHGLINRLWNSGDNLQGVIADIFCNGNYFFGTDKTWKYDTAREYIPGKRVGYDTQFIENIDFNMSQPGWNTPDFDDSKYEYAFEKNNDEHIFCEKAEVVDTYTIKPKAVEKLGADHYFVDFGKEYTGQFHMVFNGEKNQKVLLLFGEELQSDNVKQVRYDMRCNCEYKAECTLSGKRDELLFFDYMAFRYAEILTDKDNLDAKSIDMFVRHHRFDKKLSSFKSNNELLNRIWDICTQALMVSVQETYVDCPTREKGQYLGDFIVTGVAHMYLTGDSAMYRKALFDFANSCRICPGMMAVAPGAWMQEIADYSLLYPYAVLKYFQYTNDCKTAEELLPVIDNLMLYFKGYARKDGLLEGIMD